MRIAPTVEGADAAPRFGSRWLIGLFGVLLVLTLSACGEDSPLSEVTVPSPDGGGETAPETSAPESSAPETSAPPPEETSPPATEAPTETTDDGGLTGEQIALIAILGGLAVALVLGATSIISSRSQSKESERAGERSRLAQVVGGFRWVHDQGSMEIMRTSDPAQLRRAWQTTSTRMVELEGTASSMALEAEDPEKVTAFNNLGRASAGLRAALQADVSMRSDPANPARDDLVLQSSQTVQQRRMDLNTALSNPALRVQ